MQQVVFMQNTDMGVYVLWSGKGIKPYFLDKEIPSRLYISWLIMNVPKDLQLRVGKKELRYSLKAGYLGEAKNRLTFLYI